MIGKKILITGATGFIGSKLLEKLIDENYLAFILLRKSSNTWRIDHLKNKYISFEYENQQILNSFFAKNNIEIIIHVATEYGRMGDITTVLKSNLILPMELIEVGLKYGLKRFINTDTFFTKSTITPKYLKHYIESKKIFHNFLMDFSKQLVVDNMLLEHPFGENDSENKFVTKIIRDLLLNKAEILLTSGNQKRDFIYISDIIDAYMYVLKNDQQDIGFKEYEVGNGESITVKEFVQKIATFIGSNTNLKFGALSTDINEIQNSNADLKMLNKLGWLPKFKLIEAISKTVESERLKMSK